MLSAKSGPLGLGDLLDGAFRIFRAYFARLMLIAAVFFVPLGIISTLLLGAVVSGYVDLFTVAVNEPFYGDDAETAVWSSLFFLFSVFAVAILNMLCSVLAYLSLTVQALTLADGGELSVMQSIRQGMGHFWRFLGMAIIAGMMFFVVAMAAYMATMFLFFVFALMAGLFFAPVSDNEIVMIGFVGITLLVFLGLMVVVLLPLLGLTARWMAAPVAVVAERLGPMTALGRSWQLTERQTWRSILFLILLVILNFVVIGLPVALLQWLLLVALTPEMLDVVGGLVAGVSFLFNIFWQPFLAIALTLRYFDLRVRRESYDLELQIAGIEAELRPVTLP